MGNGHQYHVRFGGSRLLQTANNKQVPLDELYTDRLHELGITEKEDHDAILRFCNHFCKLKIIREN